MTGGWRSVLAITLAALAAAAVVWWRAERAAPDDGAGAVAEGAASATAGPFAATPLGNPVNDAGDRPAIAHVTIVDLDRDGLNDTLVADAGRNLVSWIRQSPAGTFTETTIAAVAAPAHLEPVDFDGDGDLDLLVASLGILFPNNNRIGSVLVFEHDGRGVFTRRVLVEKVARVADARAADFDGDGDLDVAVAGFGYDEGETSWLENKGRWSFEQHVLQRLSGGINALPIDLNGDTALDIVVLVSQEWEEIWAFMNDGRGRFQPRMLWGSTNPDFGSSWISPADMDRDGDIDLVYANGDGFDYAPANSRPWQGVQWLENRGNLQFALHRILDLQGACSPVPIDADGDGDLDVMLVTANNDWDDPSAPSILWLEQTAGMRFTSHPIATAPTHLQTVAVGDLDADGDPDLVAGGMHQTRPFDRIGRVTLFTNTRGPSRR